MLEGAKSIGAGAATIALAGAAVGIGNVLSSSIHSVARNPSLAKQSFGYAILGFALTEAIALFAPMMAFLISFVFRSHKIWVGMYLFANMGMVCIYLPNMGWYVSIFKYGLVCIYFQIWVWYVSICK